MIPTMQPQDVSASVENGAFLLDVRETNEFEAGRIDGATHIALAELPDHLDALPKDRYVICVCRSGGRSGRAASFLIEQGYQAINLEGGMIAWHEAGLPMVGDDEPFVA